MKTLRILLLFSLVLAACAPVGPENGDTASSSAAMSAEGADDTGGNGETGAAASSASGTARVIEITASDWAFTPSAITVKKGEKVTLKLTGASGVHGIGIPGLGISQRIDLGQSVSIALPTDTPGSYDFRCNVPCGAGHKEMTGTIVIEE